MSFCPAQDSAVFFLNSVLCIQSKQLSALISFAELFELQVYQDFVIGLLSDREDRLFPWYGRTTVSLILKCSCLLVMNLEFCCAFSCIARTLL